MLLVAVLLGLVGVGGCGGSAQSSRHSAASSSATPSASTRGEYLALGDSVVFGYRESGVTPAPDYSSPASFIGYPEIAGPALHLAVVNASCPGETTASFLDPTAASNGCENLPKVKATVGYRTAYPLHVSYSGSQLAFATSYLSAHSDVKLVSLMIGANDGLRCQTVTTDHCLSEITGVTKRVTRNVTRILSALRATGYGGRLVVVEYYSTDYGNALTSAASRTINAAIRAGTHGHHVVMADGYAAWKPTAAGSGGDSCAAGLLTRLSSGGCGVHPSALGQSLLAKAVEQAAAG